MLVFCGANFFNWLWSASNVSCPEATQVCTATDMPQRRSMGRSGLGLTLLVYVLEVLMGSVLTWWGLLCSMCCGLLAHLWYRRTGGNLHGLGKYKHFSLSLSMNIYIAIFLPVNINVYIINKNPGLREVIWGVISVQDSRFHWLGDSRDWSVRGMPRIPSSWFVCVLSREVDMI